MLNYHYEFISDTDDSVYDDEDDAVEILLTDDDDDADRTRRAAMNSVLPQGKSLKIRS